VLPGGAAGWEVGNLESILFVQGHMRTKVWLAVVGLSLVAASCGTQGATGAAGAGGASPDSAVHDGADHDSGGSGGSRKVEPNPRALNPHPVAWDKARLHPGEPVVTISYWGGIGSCYALARVEVEYREDAIAIGLFEGTRPRRANVACPDVAMRKATDVALDEPVGDRRVVDLSKA
jgi:hypothetical protein